MVDKIVLPALRVDMNRTEAQTLIECGFYESQTSAALYAGRGAGLDFLGLDLAFGNPNDGKVNTPP